MLRNMVTSLLRHERIQTTAPKAKVARRYAERMITLGKRGDLHARRTAARFINDETVLKKLFDDIAPKFAERQGGYTRILRSGVRKGDAADMAILELVTVSGERPKKVGNRKSRERLAEFKLGDDRKAAAKAEAATAVEEPEADAAEDVEASAGEASEESPEEPAADEAPEDDKKS
jgi:large subunit ribosomal protein L17